MPADIHKTGFTLMLKCLAYTLLLLSVTACPATESSETQAPETQASQQAVALASAVAAEPVDTEAEPARAGLLIGRWVSAPDPDTGFEPWLVFDVQKYYADGNEEGAYYQLSEDSLTYYAEAGTLTLRVLTLNETTLITETEDGHQTTWHKAELE